MPEDAFDTIDPKQIARTEALLATYRGLPLDELLQSDFRIRDPGALGLVQRFFLRRIGERAAGDEEIALGDARMHVAPALVEMHADRLEEHAVGQRRRPLGMLLLQPREAPVLRGFRGERRADAIGAAAVVLLLPRERDLVLLARLNRAAEL